MLYYKIDAAAPLQPPELGLTQFSFIRRVCNVPLCSFFFTEADCASPLVIRKTNKIRNFGSGREKNKRI